MSAEIVMGNLVMCNICHKRIATKLCDMPVRRTKNFHIKINGMTDTNLSFKEYTATCDKYICDKCAAEVGNGIHFCKSCMSKLKRV